MAGFEVTHKVTRYIPIVGDNTNGGTFGDALDEVVMRYLDGQKLNPNDDSRFEGLPVESITLNFEDMSHSDLRDIYSGLDRGTPVSHQKSRPAKVK